MVKINIIKKVQKQNTKVIVGQNEYYRKFAPEEQNTNKLQKHSIPFHSIRIDSFPSGVSEVLLNLLNYGIWKVYKMLAFNFS